MSFDKSPQFKPLGHPDGGPEWPEYEEHFVGRVSFDPEFPDRLHDLYFYTVGQFDEYYGWRNPENWEYTARWGDSPGEHAQGSVPNLINWNPRIFRLWMIHVNLIQDTNIGGKLAIVPDENRHDC